MKSLLCQMLGPFWGHVLIIIYISKSFREFRRIFGEMGWVFKFSSRIVLLSFGKDCYATHCWYRNTQYGYFAIDVSVRWVLGESSVVKWWGWTWAYKCGQQVGEKNKQTYKHHKTGDLWSRHKISNVRKEEECNRDDAGCYISFSSQTNAIHWLWCLGVRLWSPWGHIVAQLESPHDQLVMSAMDIGREVYVAQYQ